MQFKQTVVRLLSNSSCYLVTLQSIFDHKHTTSDPKTVENRQVYAQKRLIVVVNRDAITKISKVAT